MTNLFGQPAGSGLNSLAELVRELTEVGHDVLAYHPSSLVWRHRVEFFGRYQPGRVSHISRIRGDAATTETPDPSNWLVAAILAIALLAGTRSVAPSVCRRPPTTEGTGWNHSASYRCSLKQGWQRMSIPGTPGPETEKPAGYGSFDPR